MPRDISALDPHSVCAVLEPFLVDGRRERIDAVVASRLVGLTVVIENLHDPHNGAAVLRSAEAFGLQTVHVVEAAERFRFSSDVSQGCQKWLDVERHPTFGAAVARLRAGGFALYAAAPEGEVSWDELDFSRPAAVVVGNEHGGLTPEAMAAVDARFRIPMAGMTRSLNLSVAAALIVSRAATARRLALAANRGPGAVPGDGDLDDLARVRLRARFYAASVRGAEQILTRALGARR
jgi:tRNA (guanosine-2'-O-)-methyltransferase